MQLLSTLAWLAAGAAAAPPSAGNVANPLEVAQEMAQDVTKNLNLAYAPKGVKTVGYYGNWGIYAAKFDVTKIPQSKLTHLQYAFANINNKTGEVFLSDTYADLQYIYPGDVQPSKNDKKKYLFGNLKQLYLLKEKNRNLKTSLSIGGWSYRMNYPPVLASEKLRKNFAETAVKLVAELGFDGIDIDDEYVSDKETEQFVDLIRRLRKGLDNLQKETKAKVPFLLSIASPAAPEHYKALDFQKLTPLLDFYNYMGVDYMTPTSDKYTGHQSNLYKDPKNPRSTRYNTDDAIKYYINVGKVPPNKIVLQNPLYGRAWNETCGLGKKFEDAGNIGSLGQNGTWYYKDLPVPGFDATVVNDKKVGASYSYDAKKEYLISYDTVEIALQKVDYVKKLGLSGTAWWEISQDRSDDKSIITNTFNAYGGQSALEKRENNLCYPRSPYELLKKGCHKN